MHTFGLACLCASVLLFTTTEPSHAFDPLVSSELPQDDSHTALVQGLQAAAQGRWIYAQGKIRQAGDPLARDLYDWMYFRESKEDLNFGELSGFLARNGHWPETRRIRERAESLLPRTLTAPVVVDWFTDFPPLTDDGMDRYLRALMRARRASDARAALQTWWRTASLSVTRQAYYLETYGDDLDRESHAARLDHLLFAGHNDAARTLAEGLGDGYPALADARIALAAGGTANVDVLIRAVPRSLQNDAGLAYERLRWRRKREMDYPAMEILHSAPPAATITNPAAWWTERHIIARRLMDNKQHESAYLLVAAHRQTEGLPFAQAEWLAGWLALSFLNQPAKALEHFEKLYHGVKTPVSKARGAYWAGLARYRMGQIPESLHWFEVAAAHPETFYGQSAAAYLVPAKDSPLKNASSVSPSMAARESFHQKDMARAARLLSRAGLRRETSLFLMALAADAENSTEFTLAADLAYALGHRHDALRIARLASGRGIVLPDHSYPLLLVEMQGVRLEWALVHALIRQESGFDTRAVSPAGARGLMQLMPATAQEVARKAGLRHSTASLTTDPVHNIVLGTQYLEEMLEAFDGSYPLALAAYNAGPARVRRWLKDIGDPRTGEIDLVTWIESIPFYETRNYVQRVLESVHVYRLRLGDIQNHAPRPIHIPAP